MARIHIEKAEIEKMLKVVGTCVVPNRALPTSEYIRITTKGDRIKMESANPGGGLRTYAALDMPAEDLSFCVNHKDLSRYINAVADDSVTLDIDLKGSNVTVLHSSGELGLPCIEAKDFPDMESPDEKDCTEFTICGESISGWLQKIKNFTTVDNLRPVLSGAYLEGADGRLTLSASDTKVLYNDSIDEPSVGQRFGAIIPSSAFDAIMSVSGKSETVKAITNGKKIWFKAGSTTLMVVLLVGKYPNVSSVIPGNHQFEACVSKKRLLEALKRISLAIGASHIVNFVFNENGILSLSHENTGEMKTASECITYEGAINFAIGFGHEAFIKALSAMDSDDVAIRFNDPRHAAVLKEPEGAEGKTVLIMPMATVSKKA